MDIVTKINKADNIWKILPDLSVKDLERVIQLSAEYYYNKDELLITDEVYDILKERLQLLEPDSHVLTQIGAPVKGRKYRLPVYLGSMDKIKDDEKLIEKWTEIYEGPYVISDKLDGISCLLTVIDGQVNLYTRGDGNYATKISHLASLINIDLDTLLEQNKDILIRGELVMTKKNFKKYVTEKSDARTMVSGISLSKPESINKKYAQDIDFVAHELIKPIAKPSKQMILMRKWELNVVYYDIYDDINLEILESILQERKKRSPYEIDGIIVTDNAIHPRVTSGNPPYSFAYKGPTPTADVKVLDVIWAPSKDGILVPRVHYEKVRLSQADLEYAQGFNAKFIVDNKIGPGAIITVVRSGDVIPYILGVVKPAKKPALPMNMEYEWDDNHVNLILKNAIKNKTVIIQRLTKFVRDIGVENMAEGIVTRLVEAGYDSIPKIVSLTIEDLLSVEGFQKTLAEKLYYSLQNSLANLDILTLMVASNIFGRGFGERKIKKILEEYPDIVTEYQTSKIKSWNQRLMNLEGFSDITVDKFLDALPEFQVFYRKIKKLVDIKPFKKAPKKKGAFQNEIVVFTGFRNKAWEEFIESKGGRMAGTVSKNTTLLVYKDGEETSNKYKTAQKLGIKTIKQSAFAKKYNI